jgi:hypothetical protein
MSVLACLSPLHRLGRMGALLLAAASMPLSAHPQELPSALDALKAQILFRAMLFVEWPAATLSPGQALGLCVLDDGPLAAALQGLNGRSINGHVLEARKVRAEQSAAMWRWSRRAPTRPSWPRCGARCWWWPMRRACCSRARC